MANEQSSDSRYWDGAAGAFDDEPDHGLLQPSTREAWRRLLQGHLPPAPADVVDLGSGTGTVSLLLAEQGYSVRGVDFSPAMVASSTAKAEAAGCDISFVVGDASRPPFEPGSCDVVMCRHVLWALPEPVSALRRWTRLLRPGGRLLLVEGRWSTGAGLDATECTRMVLECRDEVEVVPLTDPLLWGRQITDERYLAGSVR